MTFFRRASDIGAAVFAYPEANQDASALKELKMLLMECSEEEAEKLIPIIKTVRDVLKASNSLDV